MKAREKENQKKKMYQNSLPYAPESQRTTGTREIEVGRKSGNGGPDYLYRQRPSKAKLAYAQSRLLANQNSLRLSYKLIKLS